MTALRVLPGTLFAICLLALSAQTQGNRRILPLGEARAGLGFRRPLERGLFTFMEAAP